jgi:hypothetical protein
MFQLIILCKIVESKVLCNAIMLNISLNDNEVPYEELTAGQCDTNFQSLFQSVVNFDNFNLKLTALLN